MTPRAPCLLLALACCLLAACEGGPPASSPVPSQAATSPAASPAPTIVGPDTADVIEPCPPAPDTVLAGQRREAVIRVNPLMARLCVHPPLAARTSGAPPAAPDYLYLDQDEARSLAALYAELRPAPAGAPCTAELGPTVSVQFNYPDGSAVAVLTELYGCSSSRLDAEQDPPLAGPTTLRRALDALARAAKPYEPPIT